MKKVITYGTFDLLHYGHIRLLKRARALGDYLIVGVTADDFDKTRGKINVKQPLIDRVEAVRATGLADQIIIEEYEGQKIDDIRRYDVDIFTVGSDWKGKFDYLKDYCEVIYLERTEGVSSSEIRERNPLRLGLAGNSLFLNKVAQEAALVNGLRLSGICTDNIEKFDEPIRSLAAAVSYDELLAASDAIYLRSRPEDHAARIRLALEAGKHVLCEVPLALSDKECKELFALAKEKHVILMGALKTAYSTAYNRLLLLLKGGRIGQIVSVDAVCTSLRGDADAVIAHSGDEWSSIYDWGPTALLPVLQLLGAGYREKRIISHFADPEKTIDSFTKISFLYPEAVASIKVGKGVKSEGELIISGTEGYLYVPAPWWKTDYFEIRYEDPARNQRYFYQLDGEGIRYELAAFARACDTGRPQDYISEDELAAISRILGDFEEKTDLVEI